MSSSESKQSKVNYFLPIITCIVAIAVSYGTLDAQVKELEKRVSTLEERTLIQLETLNDGVTNLRVEVAKVSNDLEWLKKEMSEK